MCTVWKSEDFINPFTTEVSELQQIRFPELISIFSEISKAASSLLISSFKFIDLPQTHYNLTRIQYLLVARKPKRNHRAFTY